MDSEIEQSLGLHIYALTLGLIWLCVNYAAKCV